MTVRELREVLALMDGDTIVEVCTETFYPGDCVLAKEIIVGTEPNRICIYGEE